MPPTQFEKAGEFYKTSGGIAYGWAVVSTIDGEIYQDLQGDYIPADTIPAVAADFMMRARVGKDMHTGNQVADVLFAWPATDEINKGVEYSGRKTGLLIGWRPYDKALLDKIAAGERIGFSIGGELHESDTEAVGKFSKAAGGATGAQRRTFRAWKLNEISLVDVPAQEHALVGVVKSATGAAKLVIASTEAIKAAAPRVTIVNNADPAQLLKALDTIEGRAAVLAALKAKRKKPRRRAAGMATPTAAGAEPYKRKMAVLTSVTKGHQHTLDPDAPADCWSDTLMTSYQTSEDETEGHCHAWVYDPTTGAIKIALDSGHDHTTDAVVSPETIAAAAADDDEPDAAPCPAPCASEPAPAPTVVVVNSRAPQGVSTQPAATPTVKTEPKEPHAMADPNDKIADLEKRNARLEKMAALTDAQRAHFGKLSGSEAESYLNKSSHERDIVLSDIEKANEIVHTSIDGTVYRKNDDRRLIEMAKQLDAESTARKKAEIEKRDAEFAKKGDEILKFFPPGAKKNYRGRIVKALNAEFTDLAEYEEVMASLRGHTEARSYLEKAIGYNGVGLGPDASAPEQQLRAAVEKYQSDHKLPSYEIALLKATESDSNIRKLYDAAAVS